MEWADQKPVVPELPIFGGGGGGNVVGELFGREFKFSS